MPEFRKLEEQFGTPKWNWWLNNCAIMWFERLKDNRLKLTLEITTRITKEINAINKA